MTKHIISNWKDGSVLYSGEAESFKALVEKAVKEKVSLVYADMRGAYMRGADMIEANMSGADMRWADMRWANMRGADMSEANMSGADMSGADMRGANMKGTDLFKANLTEIKKDFIQKITLVPNEVAGLKKALIEGKVDGTKYEGDCACLVGTIAKVKGCSYKDIPKLKPNSSSPSEKFFLAIKPGDTPDKSQFTAIVLGWVEEWEKNTKENKT